MRPEQDVYVDFFFFLNPKHNPGTETSSEGQVFGKHIYAR